MSSTVGVYGEVLFDHFPDGRAVLGGAPFNVAWHLAAFGKDPLLISAVGTDAEGRRVLDAMRQWELRDSGLTRHSHLGTGRVTVHFENGEPHYDIVHPMAFDDIAAAPPEPLDWLYHGTLALRTEASRRTLEVLLDQHQGQVFLDVNLRAPWWQREAVLDWVARADWVKLNANELAALGGGAKDFLRQHQLQGLIVTRGADGAEVLARDGRRAALAPPRLGEVADTVSAGDAFASVWLLGLCRGWALETALQRAQDFASAVCRRRGATAMDRDLYRKRMDAWKLSQED